jgi:hypothetical protein
VPSDEESIFDNLIDVKIFTEKFWGETEKYEGFQEYTGPQIRRSKR